MREEFEAVRDMAALARAENDRLRERIAALEAKLDSICNSIRANSATGLIRFADSVDDR